MKQFFVVKPIIAYSAIGVASMVTIFLLLKNSQPDIFSQETLEAYAIDISKASSTPIIPEKTKQEIQQKTTPPKYVRGIYLSAYSAGQDKWRQQLIQKMKKGRINSVVIDIKDYTGYILYNSELETPKKLKTIKPIIKDLKKVLKEFKDAGIYTIARQTVFQDPVLAKIKPEWAMKKNNGGTWYNYSGLAWTNPQKKEVWDYNIAIAKEADKFGFDEINFDYIRYPSDGNLKSLNYNLPAKKTKADVLENFFQYLSKELSSSTNISVDMFGLVMDNTKTNYDLGIGQRLEKSLNYFDFTCPMMYASHYANGYLGFKNPALYPGKVVSYGIKISQEAFKNKRATLRPWLQAFSLGATYDKARINEQITATEKATSTSGWLLWNARNYYPDYIFNP